MDGNYIRRLASDSLTSAGLTHLEGLSLRDCHLTQVAEDALARLTDLTELKLDRNNLTKLPNKLLAGSPRLEQVSLILNSSSTKKSPSSVKHQEVLSMPTGCKTKTASKIALKIAVARVRHEARSVLALFKQHLYVALMYRHCNCAFTAQCQDSATVRSVSRKAPSRSLAPVSPPEVVSCRERRWHYYIKH